ncbi:MAG TPA: hypothetical protein VKK61_09440, partial [Tepidisphaeraceae bacterium]|nr:hypothetical protein [Tepidisphaeraceae bacterium]
PPQMMPAENMIETSSYSARMRELNRRREQAAREATSIVPRNQTPHRTGSRVVSAMDLASAFQEPDGNVILEEPSKFSMRKIAAFMLFLIVAGAAAVFYFQPDYRDRTVSWMNNAWANAKTKLASIDWPKSSISSAPKIADATAKRPPDQPLPYSAPIVEPPRPQPEVVVEKPAPAKPAPQQASLPQVDSTLAIDQARKLWTQAIDSEARQDFAGAVNKYQQIKRLPDDAWPKGLQLRLDIAQRRAAQTSAQ